MSTINFLVISLLSLSYFFPIFQAQNQEYDYDQSDSDYNYFLENYPQGSNKLMNVIDSCWRSNPKWSSNRQQLADCAKGFGNGALGGKHGRVYVVTDASDDPVNPKPGTLRYGVIQFEPLWIVFSKDMSIRLGNDLVVNSRKTIDGRGAKVDIGDGPCIVIEKVNHVIVHGITIHDCKPGNPGMVRRSPTFVEHRSFSDGDGISVIASSKVWIDHCYLARSADGLVDITLASTSVTVSNSYFTQHDKVMLIGHQDGFSKDRFTEVTVAFNHFGQGLTCRMPRVRYGYAHVANNRYEQWGEYALGGSSNPTIISEGNYFFASNNPSSKQVTKRETQGGTGTWTTSKDVFLNGAYFVQSGNRMHNQNPPYTASQVFTVASGNAVLALTSDAGPLVCDPRKPC